MVTDDRLMDALPWSKKNQDIKAMREINKMEKEEFLSEEAVAAARSRRSKER